MKVTVGSLIKLGACPKGIEYFKKEWPGGEADLRDALVMATASYSKIFYAVWFLSMNLDDEKFKCLALRCAHDVIEDFEKKFPHERRPRIAMEAPDPSMDIYLNAQLASRIAAPPRLLRRRSRPRRLAYPPLLRTQRCAAGA
jgi:hypothetical protein